MKLIWTYLCDTCGVLVVLLWILSYGPVCTGSHIPEATTFGPSEDMVSTAIPPTLTSTESTCDVSDGVDRAGGNILWMYMNTYGDCCRKCKATKGCVAWVFSKDENPNRCWLKYTINAETVNSNRITGIMTGPCEVSDGYNQAYDDIKWTLVDTYEECCYICQATDRCIAWVFTKDEYPHRCWLKDKIKSTTVSSNSITGITRGSCFIRDGYDRSGGDIQVFHTNTYEDCCTSCKQNPDCIAWAFSKDQNPPTCWLKGTIKPETVQANRITGIIRGCTCNSKIQQTKTRGQSEDMISTATPSTETSTETSGKV